MFGLVAAKNGGDTLSFDIATLERLGLVEYSVHDPWLKDTNTTGLRYPPMTIV